MVFEYPERTTESEIRSDILSRPHTWHKHAVPEARTQDAVHGEHTEVILRWVRSHRRREGRHVRHGSHLAVEVELREGVAERIDKAMAVRPVRWRWRSGVIMSRLPVRVVIVR